MRGLIPLSCALAAVVVLSCKGGGDDDPGAGGAGGAGGDGGSAGAPAGGAGGSDAGVGGSAGGPGGAGGTAGTGGVGGTTSTDCDPGMMRDCYSGPPSTANVGDCTVGSETCNEAGSDWGECIGEVLPATEVPTEPGQQEADEDCDGMVDEPPGS